MEAKNRNIQECSRLAHENDINMGALTSKADETLSNHIPEDLRQFDVLDEVQGDSTSDADNVDGDGIYSSDSESEFIDIDNMLDENLPDDLRDRRMHQYESKFKSVLEEKGKNHFEVLPEGWIQATHNSGLPVYMHKMSRVCSISRPYFLGPGSLRKHQFPVSGIPCLSYKRALKEEGRLRESIAGLSQSMPDPDQHNLNAGEVNCPASNSCGEQVAPMEIPPKDTNSCGEQVAPMEIPSKDAFDMVDGDEHQPKKPRLEIPFTNAKIETVNENLKEQSLTDEQVIEYCKSLFIFKSIRVMRFDSWSARRKFTKHKKTIRNLQRPTLPDGTKLITFPVLATDGDKDRGKKQYTMNPNGKSYICILHEYVQHAFKKQPTYEFKELENATKPYSATVSINDIKYKTGYGSSKKQAKTEAARETLDVLMPDLREKIVDEKRANPGTYGSQNKDLSVFDEIRIEDPRVTEFCNKTTEPTPHAILMTCLQRNYGLGDIKIDYQVHTGRNKLNEFTMTVGKHQKTVICRNKREGKQMASQAILQVLHPHIKTWGSLLRLYGNNSVKSFKEKKLEEQEITVLQSKATINQPNFAILDKLKEEMNKLQLKREANQPIGKFIPPPEFSLPTASCSNLNVVEL